ncbi:AraC family transcriptional regulator [Pectobacterium parmentieri]|uniref:AraC family transcriptional regulator n=1 Tax=Pectobacterium parmentieri TaxID=1905730 RepID=A0A0H3I410_PECPM|nr:AraC family transcriptional regulator [Pectobacterium parmentieri]AFI90340.1 Virulence-regulating transcriptional regulator virS (AraC/xylS family) [Pectobacterium parmentieri]AYH05790.1 AraC family transcriptional regulator [Pectobacterium parmentieri]AYH10330.1 AraC family transcriptional regulator [Pectobacterium parmentieri]AYH14611.1 AraC family transcriptional regulator [Pectobacterium parmentieri]AYH23314.1 AraC family transcriptional regulator [Pectobacterium parmentieri]
MYLIRVKHIEKLEGMLKKEGVNLDSLSRSTTAHSKNEESNNEFTSVYHIQKLLNIAYTERERESFGLLLYEYFHPSDYDVVNYIMMSSKNLLHALECLCRFSRLLYSGCQLKLDKKNTNTYCIEFNYLYPKDKNTELVRQFHELSTASLLAYLQWLTSDNFTHFSSMEFSYPEPCRINKYETLFACPMTFGTHRNCVYLNADTLFIPLATSNSSLFKLHEKHAIYLIDMLFNKTIKGRVRDSISKKLETGSCNIHSVASDLFMTPRTLQRRLDEEGTYFKDILEEVKMNLAEYYLIYSQYSLSHIAELVGYKEPSSFHRACLRWFRSSPRLFRDTGGKNVDLPMK